MKSNLILLTLLVSTNFYFIHNNAIDGELEEWMSFKKLYNKTYSEDEERRRRTIFTENKRFIDAHNEKANSNDASNPLYFLGINKYSDLSLEEVTQALNGYKSELQKHNGSLYSPSENLNIPKQLDWREMGYVTEIKDQHNCGSCWAFSSTGSLEGQLYKKYKKLISLSEQNLIDCSSSFGNNGCGGGLMDNAFEYIRFNHGIDSEKSYPYQAKTKTCRYQEKYNAGYDTGIKDIERNNENHLLSAVSEIGPISVAIDASSPKFIYYKNGIYDDKKCSKKNLTHAILVVGYGTDEKSGKDYWIVKNSWGKSWGDHGYIKMIRGKNSCGIASTASYPLV